MSGPVRQASIGISFVEQEFVGKKPFATRAVSRTFSCTTNENGGRTQPNPSSRILRFFFAKQRFDSLAKPLARLVQRFDSALDVVADILRERRRASPEHVIATRLVDITDSEAMLQMGMLADCTELCLELTRLF